LPAGANIAIDRKELAGTTSPHYLFVLAIPIVAALSCLSIPLFAGVRLSGLLGIATLLAGVFLLISRHRQTLFPLKAWLPWLVMITISFSWSEHAFRPNLQDLLQILSPFIVGMVASSVWYDERMLQRLLRLFIGSALFVGALAICFRTFGATGEDSPETAAVALSTRGASMTMCITACVFVSRLHQTRALGILGWLFCFGTTVLSGSRMASFAILTLLPVIPSYRLKGGRWLALAVVFLAGFVAICSRVMQERFAVERSGSLAQVDLSDAQFTAGRSAAWPLIWQEAMEQPVIGHGVGSSVFFVAQIWTDIDKPHNDYLRIIYEVGFVGLILFVAALVWQMFDLWKIARHDESPVNWPATAAFLGIWSLAIFAVTDNPIIYHVLFMNPLFALLGVAYSIRYRPKIRYCRILSTNKSLSHATTGAH
jgi:O-antigen ligase